MLDTDDDAGLLQAFGGRIEIVQVIPPERLEQVDVAVFTCAPRFLQDYLDTGAYLPPVTLDLTGGDRTGPVFVDPISADASWRPPGATPRRVTPIIAPRAETIALVRILERLHLLAGIEACEATILESASEQGSAAMNQLQEETVQILSFQQTGNRSAQRAFNLIGPDEPSARRASRIARQIGSVSSDGCPAPAIQFARVPVFQGSAQSVYVRLGRDVSVEDIANALNRPPAAAVTGGRRSSLETIGDPAIHLSSISEGADPNAFWLWLVTDNLRLAAQNAARLIQRATLARE
jgi:aspartate-semialdehyde dehydrogenase